VPAAAAVNRAFTDPREQQETRKSARQRGKSDRIDALNVARAALQEGLDSFPAAHLDGPELDLRLLVDHRERLVRHRVELNSTLLWHWSSPAFVDI